MNVHNFTDDDSSEDDEFYFDDDFEKYKNPVVKDKETQGTKLSNYFRPKLN